MTPEPSAEDQHEHEKLVMRFEIVEGLIAAQGRWIEVSAVVEAADDRAVAVDSVRVLLGVSVPVAHHVLDMTLGRRSRLGRAELASERDALRRQLDGA